MILRKTPENIENFILADNNLGYFLQSKGFMPLYIDADYIYFPKIKEIENIIKGGEYTE